VRAALAAAARVRILLRDGVANPFGGDVEVVRGDLANAASLRLATLGVDKVVLTLPQAADPVMAAGFGRNAIAAAEAAGVKLLVWNSGGPVPPTPTGIAVMDCALAVARSVRESPVPSITLRPTLCMDSLTAPSVASAILHNGILAHPLPRESRVSWISGSDLAASAAAALQRPDLAGRTFDLGGPQALTGPETAEILSIAVGRRVAYVPVPLSYYAAGSGAGRTGDAVGGLYAWLRRQPAAPLAVDPALARAELPIRPTTLSDWARAQDWVALAERGKAA
jgi:uncharacterized protein YbjT (DUF2867 family)